MDQLRIENAALRGALNQAQMLNGSGNANGADTNANGQPSDAIAAAATTESGNGGEKDRNGS